LNTTQTRKKIACVTFDKIKVGAKPATLVIHEPEDAAQEKQNWEGWKALAKALGLSFVIGLAVSIGIGVWL